LKLFRVTHATPQTRDMIEEVQVGRVAWSIQSKSKQVKASQSKSKRVKASQSESKRVKASQSESKQVKASQSKSKRVKASSSSTSGNHGNLLAKKEWEIRWGNRRFLAGKLNEKENCSHQKQIETNTWSGEWHCRREQSLIIVMRVVKSEEKLKGKFWGEKNRKQSRMSDSKSKGEIKEWNHDLLKGRKKAWGNILKRGKEEKRKRGKEEKRKRGKEEKRKRGKEEIFLKGEKGKRGRKEKKRKWI